MKWVDMVVQCKLIFVTSCAKTTSQSPYSTSRIESVINFICVAGDEHFNDIWIVHHNLTLELDYKIFISVSIFIFLSTLLERNYYFRFSDRNTEIKGLRRSYTRYAVGKYSVQCRVMSYSSQTESSVSMLVI